MHVLGLELTSSVVADWNRSAVSPTTEERAAIATAIAQLGDRLPTPALRKELLFLGAAEGIVP